MNFNLNRKKAYSSLLHSNSNRKLNNRSLFSKDPLNKLKDKISKTNNSQGKDNTSQNGFTYKGADLLEQMNLPQFKKDLFLIDNHILSPLSTNTDSSLDQSSSLNFPNKMNPDDSVSFSNPNQVKQTHLNMIFQINPYKKALKAVVKVFYSCISPHPFIILDNNDITIRSIYNSEGLKLEYKINLPDKAPKDIGKALIIYLNKNKSNCVVGQKDYFSIEYDPSSAAVGIQFHSKYLLLNKEIPMFSTKGEAINARSYVPCQDSPSVKISVSAQLIYPRGLTALFSGEAVTFNHYSLYLIHNYNVKELFFSHTLRPELSSSSSFFNSDSLIEYESKYFLMEKRIPSYLITITLGYFTFIDIEKSICRIYFEKTAIETPKSLLFTQKIKNTYSTCNEYYSYLNNIYPYSLFNNSENPNNKIIFVILPSDFYSSGMENPNTILMNEHTVTMDGSYENVIGHELAHFWSGNLITCKNWKYFWINEGITTYLQRRAIRHLKNKQYYLGKRRNNKIIIPLKDTSLRGNVVKSSNTAYIKAFAKKKREKVLKIGDLIFSQELTHAQFGLNKALKESISLKQPKSKRLLEPPIEGDPFMYYSRISYDKGSLMMMAIEENIGGSNMELFLRKLFQTFAFKSLTGEEFRELYNSFLLEHTIKEKTKGFSLNSWFESEELDLNMISFGATSNQLSGNLDKIVQLTLNLSELYKNYDTNKKKKAFKNLLNIFKNLDTRTLSFILSKVGDLVKAEIKTSHSSKYEIFEEFIKYCDSKSYILKEHSGLLSAKVILKLKSISDSDRKLNYAVNMFKKQRWFHKKYHKEILSTIAEISPDLAEKLLKKKEGYMSSFVYKYFSHIVSQIKSKKNSHKSQ